MAILIPSRNHGAAHGRLALLRQIARTGVMRVIDGLPLTGQTATLLLTLYERLTPYAQEEFAAECNLGFWQTAQRLLSAAASESKGVLVVLYAK